MSRRPEHGRTQDSPFGFLDSSAFFPLLERDNPLHARLMQHILGKKAVVCIDTIVLSEYLVGIADSSRAEEIAENFAKQFRIHSFDARTAVVCAELFKILKAKGQIPKKPTDRQLKKVDVMIMASAIVSGVDEFIFGDRYFANVTDLLPNPICGFKLPTFLRLNTLPRAAVQTELGMES